MKARVLADSTRGPGYAVLELRDLPALAELADARVGLRRGDGRCLGTTGWQVGDVQLLAPTPEWRDGAARLSLGPDIVDHMASENIQLTLRLADGTTHGAVFPWGAIAKSPAAARRGGVGSSVVPPAPVPPPLPEPAPAASVAAPIVDAALRRGSRLGPWAAVALLALVALAATTYKFWPPLIPVTPVAPVAQPAPTELPAPSPAPAAAPPAAGATTAKSPPATSPPATPAPPDQAPTAPALAPRDQAHAALRSGIAVEPALQLARDLAGAPGGADAAFLLYEDAAQKGSAEAALGAGGYFDPTEQIPGSSIAKDPAEAWRYYRRARDAGQPEAEAKLARLRQWVEAEAARGGQAAKELLAKW